jgi:four helix bundle protein
VTETSKKYIDGFRQLDVYQRAFSLSLEIHKASLLFPAIEQYALASQLRRASKSICANIAEGYAKQSFSLPEFMRFIGIALASASECSVWVDYALALGYIDETSAIRWNQEFMVI